MDKYVNKDGKVGVIVSPGYGAGWSTWGNDKYRDFLAMDKTLVEMKVNDASAEAAEQYARAQLGEDYLYSGGWSKAQVEWLEPGTHFTINEYDGFESLKYLSDISMIA